MSLIQLTDANSEDDFRQLRELFLEYAKSLQISLCFQRFDEELANLPRSYGPPDGRAILGWHGPDLAGCVASRKISQDICEMKRLYVRPIFRGKGLGRLLVCSIIKSARNTGYKKMRLDTLPSMHEAIVLYERLGFRSIDPYYHNPNACAIYLEHSLS